MTTNLITYRATLDTFKNGIQRILQGFNTAESTIRTIEISLVCGSDSYSLPMAGITASMYVKRPSQDSPSINACTIDYENNKVIYNVLAEDISEAGIVEMQLKIIDSIRNSVLVSPMFGLQVWASNVDDSDAEQDPTYTSLTQALAAAEAMKDSAIKDIYIDDDTHIFTVVFGDDTTYTSDVIADAVSRIDDVETYATSAENSAISASNSAISASNSATIALASASSASASATNASESASSASTSATNASSSESNASASESNASASASNASTSASNANTYKELAKTYSDDAEIAMNSASTYASNASASASSASTSATNANLSASSASTSATSASEKSVLSESYCKGGTNTREGEDTDNCLYYKNLCESYASGGLIPSGTITFAELALQEKIVGHMYTIKEDFTSTSDFEDGGGILYPAWTTVYCTLNYKWDCNQGAAVVGVKGNAETDYRRGNINITKANIGLGNVDNTADADKNVATAVKATQDANGNVISSTYATKTDLNNGSVTKVGTANVGSATKPVYLNEGVPTACTYGIAIVTELPANPDANTFYVII